MTINAISRDRPYDHRNCQSLFGYAARVHANSGAICQLCGCGGQAIDFDLWGQFTVEHLVGESQGGHFHQIRGALSRRFPEVPQAALLDAVQRLDEHKTISACSFCNSTRSRDRAQRSMEELLSAAQGDLDSVVAQVAEALHEILDRKREAVAWKLAAIKPAFDRDVLPRLMKHPKRQRPAADAK